MLQAVLKFQKRTLGPTSTSFYDANAYKLSDKNIFNKCVKQYLPVIQMFVWDTMQTHDKHSSWSLIALFQECCQHPSGACSEKYWGCNQETVFCLAPFTWGDYESLIMSLPGSSSMQIQIKVVLTRYISVPIRNLVHSDCGDVVFPEIGSSWWTRWRHPIWRLPIQDELIIDFVKFVGPLVLVHCVTSPYARGGSLHKKCDGYVRPHWPPFSNRLSLNDPLSIFHILLSPNDPIFKMLCHLMTPFFSNIYFKNGRHALTEWRPFPPINDPVVICTQYLFGRRDSCSC